MLELFAKFDRARFVVWSAVVVFAVAAVGPAFAACCCADDPIETVAVAEAAVPSCHHEPEPESDPLASLNAGGCLCVDHAGPETPTAIPAAIDGPQNSSVHFAKASVSRNAIDTHRFERIPASHAESLSGRAFVRHCAFLI